MISLGFPDFTLGRLDFCTDFCVDFRVSVLTGALQHYDNFNWKLELKLCELCSVYLNTAHKASVS